MYHLILASASPRRKKLFEQLGLTFSVHSTEIKEEITSAFKPAEAAENLATQKAQSISSLYAESVIVGADTIVVLDENILGKPANHGDAKTMLRQLSSRSHTVITGVCLLRVDNQNKLIDQLVFHEKTKVTFNTLTEKEIDFYVSGGSPMDKAGAYGIQDDWGSVFVSAIEGDYYNVVGFPLHEFYTQMKKFAPEIIEQTFFKNEISN